MAYEQEYEVAYLVLATYKERVMASSADDALKLVKNTPTKHTILWHKAFPCAVSRVSSYDGSRFSTDWRMGEPELLRNLRDLFDVIFQLVG